MNKVVIGSNNKNLEHMGIRGMRWGVRRAERKANSLEKKVRKTVTRFDKGKSIPEGKIQDLSKKVRTQKYKVDKKIKRGKKFLAKHDKANAKQIINRYNRDPVKKEAVDNYVKSLKLNSESLAELRMQLIDVKL